MEYNENLYTKEYFTNVTQKNSGIFMKYKHIIQNSTKLRGINICDIGCAQGNFINEVYEGNNCYGFDISSEVISKCKERFPNISNNFGALDLNNQNLPQDLPQFDVITMFDVIEHLENYTYLRKILRDKLTAGGYFIVTTPNANSILRMISRNSFTGEIDKTHINLFTPYTLDFFLRKAGLKKLVLATPFPFYLKADLVTKNFLLGGQIFAIYKKDG